MQLLEERIYQECPEVQLSLFAITSSKVPDYDLYKNTSRKKLLTLILKDKVMIFLYILVLLIIIVTVTAYVLHI